MIQKSNLVRKTCNEVMKISQHVKINSEKCAEMALIINKNYIDFESYDCHFSKQTSPETLLEYLFVLDTLNFCFWPQKGFEYDNLAAALKKLVLADQNVFNPSRLAKWSKEEIKDQIFEGQEFPLLDERVRLIQESGNIVMKYFDGSYAKLVQKAQNSCQDLLFLLASYFTGFQDHSMYNGKQVFFYKRSQILIADIYAAFNGKGYGEFYDIDLLTMFPDYRVPQILREKGVLIYSKELDDKIMTSQELPHGCIEEVEIRSATVVAVEELRNYLQLKSIEVDWILWQLGEELKDKIYPHHRTLSIYY